MQFGKLENVKFGSIFIETIVALANHSAEQKIQHTKNFVCSPITGWAKKKVIKVNRKIRLVPMLFEFLP
jgi:hypothetical protein